MKGFVRLCVSQLGFRVLWVSLLPPLDSTPLGYCPQIALTMEGKPRGGVV